MDDQGDETPSPAAPLALRLFVEAVLAAPYDERNAG